MDSWKIISESFNSYVEYFFNEPQPIVDADPTLFIDGVQYSARWLRGRQRLRVAVPDEMLSEIHEVLPPALFFRKVLKGRRIALGKRKATVDIQPRVRVPDALAPGSFNVVRYDYDYGDEVLSLPGTIRAVELRAAVYMPENSEGVHPLVIFVHGFHYICYNEERPTSDLNWPCGEGFVPKPSYEGYSEPAHALASQGYIVVSISANGILGGSFEDSATRGHLILAHLDLLADANNGARPELSILTGKLDLQNVGLMGHSRGGEGVARAITLNRLLHKGYGLRAALLLGATAVRDIAIPDTHTAFILPFLDGDVVNLEGQWVSDLSRYAFDDDVLRSSVLMLGANHNFFNSMWSPGVVGGLDDTDARWGEVEGERLTQVEQRLLGAFYVAGFFRLILGGEPSFFALFDGSLVRIPSLPRAEMRSSAHFPASSRYVVQSFETLYDDQALLMPGSWTWSVREGSGQIITKVAFDIRDRARYSHDELHSFLNLKSQVPQAPAELELHIQEGSDPLDVSPYTHLNFHIAHLLEDNADTGVELDITIGGAIVDVSSTLLSLMPIPEIIPGVGTLLQQQVSVPLTQFSIDPGHPIESILFTLARGGNIYLSDVVFVKPSLGFGGLHDLPFVSFMEDKSLVVTGAEQVVDIQLFLSAESSAKVAMRVECPILHRRLGLMNLSTRVVFEPGETSATARFIIPPGGLRTDIVIAGPDGNPCYLADVSIRGLSNALMDRDLMNFFITPCPWVRTPIS